jgi:predicted RecA/RadA family phage recombinase
MQKIRRNKIMAISLNQFAPNEPVAGLYVYQANLPQLHNPIISANQATALTYGAVVTLDSAVSNADAPVIKQAAVTDNIFGVVVFSSIKPQSQLVSGERVALARANDIVWMPAAGAIAQGAVLYFDATNKVTSTATAGNSIIGKAITSAAAAGDYVQVELGFATTSA